MKLRQSYSKSKQKTESNKSQGFSISFTLKAELLFFHIDALLKLLIIFLLKENPPTYFLVLFRVRNYFDLCDINKKAHIRVRVNDYLKIIQGYSIRV